MPRLKPSRNPLSASTGRRLGRFRFRVAFSTFLHAAQAARHIATEGDLEDAKNAIINDVHKNT